MIRLFIGKMGSGKTYWCKKNAESGLSLLVPYTTRPARPSEINGVDYYFISDSEFAAYQNAGWFMETRSYEVIQNGTNTIWKYATSLLKDEERQKDWCMITTPVGCYAFIDTYGSDFLEIILVESDPTIREQRIKQRGTLLDKEYERRLTADEEDFSLQKILNLQKYYGKSIEVIHNSSDKPTFSKIGG